VIGVTDMISDETRLDQAPLPTIIDVRGAAALDRLRAELARSHALLARLRAEVEAEANERRG
jgi:hypothetical protein